MQKWMIPANPKIYDYAKFFDDYGYVDWKQRLKFEVGDIVYLYCSKPFQKVMYKTEVLKESMPFSDCTEDRNYWTNPDDYETSKSYMRARLKLLGRADREELSIEYLKDNGLNAAPQKGVKVPDNLAEYMDKYFELESPNMIYPESDIPENYHEGAVTTITVNKYERNPLARKKCIEYHGCECSVCGLSFEKMYGDLGKGFIHVHHIVPLNQIKEDYEVNYKTDLIPVCPNCHAMLHRKVNNEYYSVEELKSIVGKKKQN